MLLTGYPLRHRNIGRLPRYHRQRVSICDERHKYSKQKLKMRG